MKKHFSLKNFRQFNITLCLLISTSCMTQRNQISQMNTPTGKSTKLVCQKCPGKMSILNQSPFVLNFNDSNSHGLTLHADWGDESKETSAVHVSPDGQISLQHNYNEIGSYTINLSIHDANGKILETLKHEVYVLPPEDPTCFVCPENGLSNENIPFQIDLGDQVGSGHVVSIDWGDGIQSQQSPVINKQEYVLKIDKLYAKPGAYNIKLSIEYLPGRFKSLEHSIRIRQGVAPIGQSFKVNTSTTGHQNESKVAFGTNGNFVISWFSGDSTYKYKAQCYDQQGRPIGDEVIIKEFSDYPGIRKPGAISSLGTDNDDNFYFVSAESDNIYLKRFNKDCTSISNGINFSTQPLPYYPIEASYDFYDFIKVDKNGNFILTWKQSGQNRVHVKRFDPNGKPIGNEFLLNLNFPHADYRSDEEYLGTYDIALDSNNDFIVVYARKSNSFDSLTIGAQRYRNDGTPINSEFQVSSNFKAGIFYPNVAVSNNGDFIIAWEHHGEGASYSPRNIYARYFSKDGVPLSNDFQVNSTDDQYYRTSPYIETYGDGNFMITWFQSKDHPGGPFGVIGNILAQRYNHEGKVIGEFFQIKDNFSSVLMSPITNFSRQAQSILPGEDSLVTDLKGNIFFTWADTLAGGGGQQVMFNNFDVYAKRCNSNCELK